jgi:hypothetical protein
MRWKNYVNASLVLYIELRTGVVSKDKRVDSAQHAAMQARNAFERAVEADSLPPPAS